MDVFNEKFPLAKSFGPKQGEPWPLILASRLVSQLALNYGREFLE